MNRTIFRTGIIFGVLAIVLGAFGAHGLERLIDAESVETFETGVTYQLYHSLFLLILASIKQISDRSKRIVFYLISAGIVLFSFSIYFLATDSLTSINFKTIGFVTPIGGLLLISGWVWLGLGGFSHLD